MSFKIQIPSGSSLLLPDGSMLHCDVSQLLVSIANGLRTQEKERDRAACKKAWDHLDKVKPVLISKVFEVLKQTDSHFKVNFAKHNISHHWSSVYQEEVRGVLAKHAPKLLKEVEEAEKLAKEHKDFSFGIIHDAARFFRDWIFELIETPKCPCGH